MGRKEQMSIEFWVVLFLLLAVVVFGIVHFARQELEHRHMASRISQLGKEYKQK